jgi:hypothetical protein
MERMERLSVGARAGEARRATGGAEGNSRLTAAVAAVLIVLLAVEGATIPFVHPLLTVHVFVGMLLLGPVALKLGTTGYRFVRYYTGSREYVAKGPPATFMRLVVAPVVVASTVTLFATGVALVAFGSRRGPVLGLHKASFLVWFVAMSLHVLWYLQRVAREGFADVGRRRIAGAGLRVAVVAGAVAAGTIVAALTLPLATSWAHWASLHMH